MSHLASVVAAAGRPVDRQRRYLAATLLRRNPGPRWATENAVIAERPGCRVRRFVSPAAARAGGPSPRPVLIVPPEVNHSYVVDFSPEQSLVRTIQAAGFTDVAAIEWLSPEAETRHRDIDDSVGDILHAIDRLGGPVHLVGVCQGGWESAIAAALAPAATATLTLVAAPIDFSAGEGLVKHLAATLPMAAYRGLVALGRGSMPGRFVSVGFDGLQPLERLGLQPLSIWNHLDDEAWMARYLQLNDWYRCHKDLPGRLYLRAVRELFKQNRLIRGRLVVLGSRIDLARIRCPLVLVAGLKDHITPPPQLLATRRHVSSAEQLVVETQGGHIGTFMGREELRRHWPGILAWIRDRDPA